MDHFMHRSIRGREVLKVQTESELSDRLGAKFKHILIDVPSLALLVKFIKYRKSILDCFLHCGSIVTNSFWAKCRRKKLVRNPPLRRIGVSQENSSSWCFDPGKGVCGIDFLCKEFRLSESNSCDLWIIGLIDGSSQSSGLDQWSKLLEETLVIAEVVGINFKVIADIWQRARRWWITDLISVNCDFDRAICSNYIGDIDEGVAVFALETDA